MSKLHLGWLALALLAMPARAAVLHEVFLADGPDGVTDAVEIDQINTHSELTLLVLNAAGDSWGKVLDGFTLITGEVGDNTALISDGAFPQGYGAIADPAGTRPMLDITDPGHAAVTKLLKPSKKYTDGLDLSDARLLVLLAGRPGQDLVGSFLTESDFDTQKNTLSLSNAMTVEVLDWWGYDAQPEKVELFPGFEFDSRPGLDPDGYELDDVHGSSVLIRDPDALTFVDGNSDEDGYLAGSSPRIRITPGVSNPLFGEVLTGSELIPEPTAAALVALGVAVVLLRRPMRTGA